MLPFLPQSVNPLIQIWVRFRVSERTVEEAEVVLPPGEITTFGISDVIGQFRFL